MEIRGLQAPVPRLDVRDPVNRPVPHSGGSAEHDAAVRRTLGLADDAAAQGDFAEALAWLATIEAIGDPLPARYVESRGVWTSALERAGR